MDDFVWRNVVSFAMYSDYSLLFGQVHNTLTYTESI